jgi:hypothetical protein
MLAHQIDVVWVPTHIKPTWAWKIVRRHFTPRTYRNALYDPQIPPDAKIEVRHNMSWCTFCRIRTGPTRAWKLAHRRFTARMHHTALCDPHIPQDAKHMFGVTCPGARRFMPRLHQNALHDPQIPTHAKTQFQHNVSGHTFSRNCTRSTQTWKIVHWCFAHRTHQNTLRDPHITPDANTQVCRNVS